jgi:DNA-binding NtrC family response regulator
MARVLVVHHDKTARTILEAMTKRQHELLSAKNVEACVKLMRKNRPDLIVIGQDAAKQEAVRLLQYLKDNGITVPVVAVASRGGGTFERALRKLGARGFLEYPVDQPTYDDALAEALKSPTTDKPQPTKPSTQPPAITKQELTANLSLLETRLNQKMKCFAGKNQVFIRSLISGGKRAKPRICLKCPLRAEYGLNREVYFEFIRDVCCCKPGQCEAVQTFQAKRRMTG